MSVGFGFSVGDFLAAIKLVGTVIDALSASSQSSSELRELLRQLYSLETALREVKHLEVDESLYAEVLALKQSAAQCQLTISNFLSRIQSYQPYLLNSAESTLLGKWKRIQWTLCKKKDVMLFKADLLAHTESTQLLLTTIQMKNVGLGQKLQTSIATRIQDGFSGCMRKCTVIGDTVTRVSSLAQECLANTRQIISLNIRVFQAILDLQNLLLSSIPGQIERQQPVFLNDALGRSAPFHLEFIRSPEALISVLSINFMWLGSASMKIQNGEFSIQDARTRRDIDLYRPWEECFLPGQRVEMSMIFHRSKASTSCPSCHHLYRSAVDEDVEWYVSSTIWNELGLMPPNSVQCGLVYRSIASAEISGTLPDAIAAQVEQSAIDVSDSSSQPGLRPTGPKRRYEDEEDLTRYRRVRVRPLPRQLQYPVTRSTPEEEEDYTIKCICGFSDDDGNTVLCERCHLWQHTECYYHKDGETPDVSDIDHSCVDCEPRQLDFRGATERQTMRREQSGYQ